MYALDVINQPSTVAGIVSLVRPTAVQSIMLNEVADPEVHAGGRSGAVHPAGVWGQSPR